MTFGIDVSGFQAGMDMVRARADGAEFVIVKASGFNISPPYVADEYHEHIDAVIAAGLPKGHYYLIGGGQVWKTPTEQARFFYENLYKFNPATDVLMVDNEGLNSNGYLFDDAEAAEFITELLRLAGPRFSPNRMWHYAGANDYRSLAPWPRLETLCVRFVWAAYGSYPTGQTPDHEPSLQGSISRWDVHQFTSRALVAGKSVDGNYATASVLELFGGSDMGYLEVRPARGNMNQGFGPRPKPTPTSPAIHYGQDYGWGGGDAIYAARAGLVLEYAYSGAYGNRMIVDHGGGRRTWYCHLSAPVAARGTTVEAGEQIAWMGDTGNVTAKHLHFEFRVDGVATDPEPYFTGSTTAGGGTTPIEEDDMFSDADRALLKQAAANAASAKAGIWNGGSTSIDGSVRTFRYGLLPIVSHNQTLIAQQAGLIAALQTAVAQIATGDVDMAAVQAAASAGATAALTGVDLDLSDDDKAQIAALTAQQVLAGIPENADVTGADIEAAVRRVFADAAE